MDSKDCEQQDHVHAGMGVGDSGEWGNRIMFMQVWVLGIQASLCRKSNVGHTSEPPIGLLVRKPRGESCLVFAQSSGTTGKEI